MAKDDSKQRFLEAGHSLLSAGKELGVNAVAKQAGLNKVLLYRYFTDWDGYLVQLVAGLNLWQRIRSVTLPSLSSTMKLLLILQLIGTFQVLQEPFVMTGGGPAGASTTLMYLVYNYAFVNAEFGKAGALGTLIFLFLLVLSALYVRKSDLAQGKGV